MTPPVVKALKFWGSLAVGVAAAGFSLGMLLGNYAKASELEKIRDDLHLHVVNETSKVSAVEAVLRNVEADYHWQRDQLTRIAERVGAPRVPPPEHEEPVVIRPAR